MIPRLSIKQRFIILAISTLLYVALFPLLLQSFGIDQARSASLVIIVLGGMLFGLRGGVPMALLAVAAFSLLTQPPLSIFNGIATLLVGLGTGFLSDFIGHLQREVEILRQSEARLKEHEQRYLGFFNQIADAIIITDLDLNIIDVNQQASKMLGYDSGDLLNTNLGSLIAPDYMDHAVTQILLDTNLVFEQSMLARDGSNIPVEVSVQRVYDEQGQALQIQCLVRDIRERKTAEQDHLTLEAERQRINIINQFVRDASHDFRTPLSVITTSAYLMVRNPTLDNIKNRVQIINKQVKQIDGLLDNMMAMMRLDEQPEVFTEPVQINAVLQKTYDTLKSSAQNRDISLDMALDPQLPTILGNDSWLEMAFSRLLNNAIQFTPIGGQVSVRSACKPDWIVIEFRDTGVGIAEEDLPHIWESFYRVDKSRSSASGGSGLGLTIAQKIVQRHNGQIHVDSAVGQGSTFTVTLPLG